MKLGVDRILACLYVGTTIVSQLVKTLVLLRVVDVSERMVSSVGKKKLQLSQHKIPNTLKNQLSL